MQIGEISFCGTIGYNIKDDDYKKQILNELENNFNFKVIQKHHDRLAPGCPYYERTIKRISQVPHLVSTKTNGNPYMLYLTRHNSTNQCIFIDKKIQHGYFTPRMIIVKLWFDDCLFKNTLFDGEMIKDKNGQWTFIMNDILAKQNENLSSMTLIPRLNILYDTLQNYYFEDDTSCCRIYVKKYFKYEQIEYIIHEFIPSLPYTCRGLYFKPIYLNFKDVLYNFDNSLIKQVTRTKYSIEQNKSFFSNKNEINDNKKNDSRSNKIDHTPLDDNQQIDKNNKNKIVKNVENVEKRDVFEEKCVSQCNSLHDIDCNVCVFNVNKTDKPDVYEMVMVEDHTQNKFTIPLNTYDKQLACIQNQKTSKMMREIFQNLTFLQKVMMLCEYNAKFKKWTPVKKLNS